MCDRFQRHDLSDRHALADEEIANANVLSAVGGAFFFLSVDDGTGVVGPEDSRSLLGKSKFCKYPARWSYIPSALRHGNDLSLSADASYISGQYLRGDEMNALASIDGYVVHDFFGRYELTQSLSVFWKVDNLLDSIYETFGLLGEPGEVLEEGFDNPRFLAPGPPFGVWAGFEYEF